MAVKIADTLKTLSNTFPVAECVDIDVNINGTTKRLQKAIDDGEIGGGSDSTWKGTREEWESLSTEEKGKYEVICFTDDYDESDSTWKGTRDEWEALSTEEKGKYEVICFTDDYNESDSTWKGTREEWEALSTEEKGKYEVICFTDDYNESDSTWKGTREEWEALSTEEKGKYEVICFTDDYDDTKLTELNDVDNTDIGNGKTLIYDAAAKKHKYVKTTLTDELVKMDNTSDSKHLSELIDKSTIVNQNGVLKAKKLDGQEVTIAEINFLKGLTMNVMDLVNMFANGGVKIINTPVATYSDLLTYDKTGLIDGISYLVYVLADETHDNAKTTYLIDKTSSTPTYFGNADSQRNFTTDPIDLANEVTNKLGASNIDVDALWSLLTINGTYKTLTTKNEPFGTHGAKNMYDELVEDIGEKANTADLTNHTGDVNIHVTTSDKSRWNKVFDKVDITDFLNHINSTDIHITKNERTAWNSKEDSSNKTTTIDGSSTDTQYPSAKAVYEKTKNMCTTTVADVPKTKITFTYNTNYEIVNDNCKYIIKNGICTMFLYVKCKTPANAWKAVSKVPKTSILNMCSTISSLNGDGFLRCSVNTAGELNFANGTAGTSYLGTITYQVAES